MSRKSAIKLTRATTLAKSQSGTLFAFNSSAGFTVTLPTGGEGLQYCFVVKMDPESSSLVIDAGSNSIVGDAIVVSASGAVGVFSYDFPPPFWFSSHILLFHLH